MRTRTAVIPIALLALAMGSVNAEAQTRDRQSADRGGQRGERSQSSSRDGARGRQGASVNREAQPESRSYGRASRDSAQSRSPERARVEPRRDSGRDRAVPRQDTYRRDDGRVNSYRGDAYRRDSYRGDSYRRDSYRRDSYRRDSYRRDSYRYVAPRVLPRRSPPRYYGGSRLSLYFGIGSGYRYGSPYYGRVYGYRAPYYSGYRYYGDVRLKVSPRDAAVYVDGYYAGVVDDFDGFFQRLTLEVGPHEIEIEAEGLGSQVFNVYVDPSRTVDVHADLLR